MITRRRFNYLVATGAFGLLAGGGTARAQSAAPKAYTSAFTPKGLLTQPWFLNSFLDLKDDLQEAANSGKRFAIMWELAGCPYCRETHLVNFARPDIRDYIKENFDFPRKLCIDFSMKIFHFEKFSKKKLRSFRRKFFRQEKNNIF